MDRAANPFTDTLELQPRPSRLLMCFVAVTHAAAFAVAVYLSLRWPWAVVLPAAVPVSLASSWRRVTLAAGGAVVRVAWHGDGECRWVAQNGRTLRGRAVSTSMVLPWLVILHLRADGGRRAYLPLAADSLPPEVFRRLRARLRLATEND